MLASARGVSGKGLPMQAPKDYAGERQRATLASAKGLKSQLILGGENQFLFSEINNDLRLASKVGFDHSRGLQTVRNGSLTLPET